MGLNSNINLHRLRGQCVLDHVDAHRFAGAADLPADALQIVLCQIWIRLLFDLGYFIDVLDTYAASAFMTWQWASLLQAGRLLDEIARRGRLDRKLKASVHIGFEKNSHGNISIELLRAIVELLAKLHHVDTERTQRLTNLG